jgi:hypothetical protein
MCVLDRASAPGPVPSGPGHAGQGTRTPQRVCAAFEPGTAGTTNWSRDGVLRRTAEQGLVVSGKRVSGGWDRLDPETEAADAAAAARAGADLLPPPPTPPRPPTVQTPDRLHTYVDTDDATHMSPWMSTSPRARACGPAEASVRPAPATTRGPPHTLAYVCRTPSPPPTTTAPPRPRLPPASAPASSVGGGGVLGGLAAGVRACVCVCGEGVWLGGRRGWGGTSEEGAFTSLPAPPAPSRAPSPPLSRAAQRARARTHPPARLAHRASSSTGTYGHTLSSTPPSPLRPPPPRSRRGPRQRPSP